MEFVIDPNTANKEVIPYLLLPLVENAFKHGIVNDVATPLKISIKTTSDHVLKISVKNAIAHREKDAVGGIGLENLKKRLDLMYPSSELFIKTDQLTYFSVAIKLPL